ncbi:hypothetical protein ACF3NA_00440 [Alkanindiges sp. WGS2144]|uniref:hypothetical protein n=1 Tax=Alkanindiges sp. WGS2144 TaxID=3366808 RepID=UPI0037502EB7
MKLFRVLVPVWIAITASSPVLASETLSVAIPSSFQPMLESLKPRLNEQLGTTVMIQAKGNEGIYQDLNQQKMTNDVIIFVENPSLGKNNINAYLSKNSQVIAASQVVLWCPNLYLPKRVSVQDSIFQANIKSIALPIKENRVHQIFIKNIPKLPASTKLTLTKDSLVAWRMARNQQVQCSATLDKWLRPTDQFVRVSAEQIILRGYINPELKNPAKAQQMLNLLSSPLIQPLMMRSTSLELAQGTAKPKRISTTLLTEAPKRNSRTS